MHLPLERQAAHDPSKIERISRARSQTPNQDADLIPPERATLLAHIRAEITTVLLSNRARTAQPAVTDEVRTGLYFVDAIFWEALPRVYDDLAAALAMRYSRRAWPRPAAG